MTQHHDPVHPDSPHLSAEVLADLQAGLLDPESTSHARHHLTGCDTCSGVAADLDALVAALAQLPPVPMPTDRAAALDAVLAAAAAVDRADTTGETTSLDEPAPVLPDTVVPLSAARSRRQGWSTRALSAAAAVAGVLLVSAVGISLVDGGDAGSSGSPAAEGGQPTLDDAVLAADSTGQEYRKATLDEQVNTLLVSHSTEVTPSATTSTDASGAPAPMVTATVRETPTTFRASIVRPETLHACLVDYLGVTTPPLAVDVATFNGVPAALIVLPDTDDPTQAWVYVVDPNCSGPDTQLFYWAVVKLPESLLTPDSDSGGVGMPPLPSSQPGEGTP